ncbi:MAG: PilZ domain-containing protein, partial [Geminicoccaceae bacterium]
QLQVNSSLILPRYGKEAARAERRHVATLELAYRMSWNPDDPSEQRRHRRASSRIPATLLFDGGAWSCQICDISPRGAGVEPSIPAALGHMVELQSSRFSHALLGRVVNVAENRTNIAFELDSAMEYELAKFLATNIDLT